MSVENTQAKRLSLNQKIALMKERFGGREDLFYQKRTWVTTETDKETAETKQVVNKTFYLVCGRYGDEKVCWIKQGKAKVCSQCPNRENKAIDDNVYKTHIIGDSAMCVVPATERGVRVAALDFDRSLRGDGPDAVFEDAKMVRDCFNKIGLHAHIARSSDKGYHVYLFFDDWIPTYKITSIFAHINGISGLADQARDSDGPLPEQFPKQEYNKANPGSSLRIPMSEVDIRNGKNCFVDDNKIPFPLDKQWEFLSNVPVNIATDLDDIIAVHQIEIIETGAFSSFKRKRVPVLDADGKVVKDANGQDLMADAQHTLKPEGSFWNVVAGCRALQEYWAKDKEGRYVWDYARTNGVRHPARYAMMTLAISTLDGVEALKARWTGETDTEKQINHAVNQKYSPMTCVHMQDDGVCRKGVHPKFSKNEGEPTSYCLHKNPPSEVVKGVRKVIPDVPEAMWPEPSPIRFRHGKAKTPDEIKERLKYLYNIVKMQDRLDAGDFKVYPAEANKDPAILDYSKIAGTMPADLANQLIDDLINNVMKMPKNVKDEISNFVQAEGILSKADWKAKTKSAGANVHYEKTKEAKEVHKSFVHKNRTYTLKNGQIVSLYVDAKGISKEEVISNFWIERLSEPARIKLKEGADGEERTIEDRSYNLVMHIGSESRMFSVPNTILGSPSAFFSHIRGVGGTDINVSSSKDTYDIVVNSIGAFSEPASETSILDFMGYWVLQNTKTIKYIAPNKVITADSIEDNSNYILDYKDDYTRCIGFTELNPTDFKDLCQHIVKDFFNCNNPTLTMTCFAHAMSAVSTWHIEKATKYNKAPVLWIAGSFAQGKSFVLENTQYFFGDFSSSVMVNTSGSTKSKLAVANMYRHALLCFDDQKDIDRKDQGQDTIKLINQSYDRTPYTAMNRDSTLRDKSPRNQGLIAINGEDYPDKDASAASRLIPIDVSLKPRIDEGSRVVRMRHKYCGFTPRVIQYLLRMSKEDVEKLWYSSVMEFKGDAPPEKSEKSKENDKNGLGRLADNLALNYVGFWVAMQTMYEAGGITLDERNGLLEKHKKNLIIIKSGLISSVSKARGSTIFLNSFRELLADSTRYKISGWPGSETEDTMRAKSLGFYDYTTPDVVYVFASLAYEAVSELSRRQNNLLQKWGHISRQLAEDGIFLEEAADRNDGKWSCRRKAPNGSYQRVYPFKASELGFFPLNAVDADREVKKSNDYHRVKI
jgi:hypothetical protein